MHPDDLKATLICYERRMVFVFIHIDDNNDLTGHKMIEKIMVVSGAETLE